MTQILLVFNVSSCLTATNNFVFFIISLFSYFGLFPRSLNCIIRHSATRALTFNFSFATFYISLDKVTHSIRRQMIPTSKQNVSTRQSYIFRERLVARQTGQRHYDVWILLCRWIFLITFTMSMTEELQKFPDRDLTEGMGIC